MMRSHILRFFAIIAMMIVIGLLWAIFNNLRKAGYLVAFIICCGIILFIFIILIYSLLKFRKTQARSFHSHMISEVFWITIPFMILIALTTPAAIQLAKQYNKDMTKTKIESSEVYSFE